MSERYQTMTKEMAMKILDLPTNYNENDLRTNYRNKMKINHPDHNGDERLAQEINLAYELLKEKYPSSNMVKPQMSYKEKRISEVENLIVGYAEILPKWVKEIYEIIQQNKEYLDLALLKKDMSREEIDKIINSYRNEVITRLKQIEGKFCIRKGITMTDLISKGYSPIDNYSMQYNIKDIYDRLSSAYSEVFKERINQVLNKYNKEYISLEKEIIKKIEQLPTNLKLDAIVADFDNFIDNLYRQYDSDYKLVLELKTNYQDILGADNIEIDNLCKLCGKEEFKSVYSELSKKLKDARKEQTSALLVLDLNRKLSYFLSNTCSLQDTIRISRLYSKLLEAINSMDLTNDTIGLINSISADNFEKDINDILQILSAKINKIYIPRFRTELEVPLFLSCRLYNQEYFIKMIYENGIPQSIESVEYNDNEHIVLEDVLKSSQFIGGTKTANVNSNNSVICEYNDSHLNRFSIVKNKNTNTIEAYGSKKYMSYLNGNQIDTELTKYQDINIILNEIINQIMPYLKKYLYENIQKNNGRSK